MTDNPRTASLAAQVVPWVTMRRSEMAAMESTRPQTFLAARSNGEFQVIPGQRTILWTDGVVWQDPPQHLGDPDVLFGSMNATRQRLAMIGPRCQVCGTKLRGRPIRWVTPDVHVDLAAPPTGSLLTATPPVCLRCYPVAMAACPALKSMADLSVWDVTEWRPWGVVGDLDLPARLTGELVTDREPYLPGGGTRRPLCAKQMVVELTAYTKIDRSIT